MNMEGETVIPGLGTGGPSQEDRLALSEVERTVVAGPSACPVCQTENPAGTEWCEECGFFLSSEPEEVAAQPVFARLVDLSSGAEYPLKPGENILGRGASDVVLAGDAFVSRNHAKITVEAPDIYLEDLGSTNGTFLNGERVEAGQRLPIGPGDRVRFSSTTLEVVAPEGTKVEREGIREPIGVLELREGEETTGSFPVLAGENSLGRHPSNDVALGFDGYVSTRHAKITASDEGVFIEDLGSTNGTELNGHRLTLGVKEALSDGDEIKMGKTVLKWRVESRESEDEGESTQSSVEERHDGQG